MRKATIAALNFLKDFNAMHYLSPSSSNKRVVASQQRKIKAIGKITAKINMVATSKCMPLL